MHSKWHWLLTNLTRRLWFRATLFGILAVVTALIAIRIKEYIPLSTSAEIGADAVDGLLNILATSMLAVTTFSLNIMVSANGAATSNVTPRATSLLTEDRTTQNVLATFIGSFLFSLVGIIALTLGVYGEEGRVILFIVTLLVIGLIIVTLIRWIDHLSNLGNVSETSGRVEKVAAKALVERIYNPYLGGRKLESDYLQNDKTLIPIHIQKLGYIQHIDVFSLSKYADKTQCEIFICSLPGSFISPHNPVAFVKPSADEINDSEISGYFSVEIERAFDEDPRFGLSVLAEIASRSLPPTINDSGTAIDIINRGVRVLAHWKILQQQSSEQQKTLYPRIFVSALEIDDLFDDFFWPIARDGASLFEIQIKLQKALLTLIQLDPSLYGKAAVRHANAALLRAKSALAFDEEKQRLEEVVETIRRYAVSNCV